MRVLLDEVVPTQLIEPLRHIVRHKHSIDHVIEVRLAGTKDQPLYATAKQRAYEAIVTNDSSQLDDPAEVRAIARSGLHHIRYAQRPGLKGLGHALGALIAALPVALDELDEVDGQRLVRVTGLDASVKRYEVINPKETPPAYWPRRRSRRI